MLGFNSVFVLLCVVQVIYSQGPPPPKCRGLPPGVTNPRECCDIPLMFPSEDLTACGIDLSSGDHPPRPDIKDCTKQICILKRSNLIKDENKVDKDAMISFIEKWAETNPQFNDAIAAAKDRCLSSELPGPPHICEPDRANFCVTHSIFENCPNWQQNDNCKKLKDHMEECKPYFN